MRNAMRAAVVTLLGLAALPLLAADEKKTDEKKDDKKAPEMVAAGTINGKILHVHASKHTLRLRIPEVNKGEAEAIARDQAEINRVLATERNIANRNRRVAELQAAIVRHNANLYSGHKDIDVNVVDDVKVRMANLPLKFDEKGKPAAYTAEEKKALKGDDPKAVGYKAEFSDLRAEQQVQLVLMKKKGNPVLPKPEPGKDVDKSDVAAALAEYEPRVTSIVILSDVAPPK